MLDFQPLGLVFDEITGNIQGDLFTDHHLGQFLFIGLCLHDCTDVFPLAQDCDPVGDFHDFVEFVRNDDNGLAVVPHIAQDREQPGDFLRGQHRRRLIQDKDLCPAVECLDDFQGFLFGHRHIVDLLVQIHIESVPLTDVTDFLPALLFRIVFRQTDQDVLQRSENINQLEMLMNHPDAEIIGVLRGCDGYRLPVRQDFPAVRIIDPGKHIHQGCLAAAVFPQQGKDFPMINIQVNVLVGDDLFAEALVDAAHGYGNLVHASPPA